MKTLPILAWPVLLILPLLLANCGGDGSGDPQATFAPTAEPLGGFQVSCGKEGAPEQQQEQQKQVVFQQQQQQEGSAEQCTPQFQFIQQKVTDLKVRLDCDDRFVSIQSAGQSAGTETQQTKLPIQSDGKVKGGMSVQQQVQNDGKGNVSCFVTEEIIFSGKASCGSRPGETSDDQLSLQTQVRFQQSSPDAIPGAVERVSIPEPSSSPVPTDTPTDTPTNTPTESPSESPTETPSSRPTEEPGSAPNVSPSPEQAPCSFDQPERVSGPVTIHISEGGQDLGCSAFGGPISIAPGTPVTWINDDTVPHNVTADGGEFDSGLLFPGQKFTHVFRRAGEFNYHCAIDPGMQGFIEVRGHEVTIPEPGESPIPFPPSPSPSPSPSAAPRPRPTPTPTAIIRQKVVCVVANPCPVEAKAELSCPEQQGDDGQPMPPDDGGTPPF